MTHFVGAVLVPNSVPVDLYSAPSKYPDLYGADAREITPSETLDAYIARATLPFSENLEVPRWKTKAEIIAAGRAEMESFRTGTYAKYLEDPEAYEKEYSRSEDHLNYLRKTFPERLARTDEEVYQDQLQWEDEGAVRESDGAVYTTWNENGKWDWYTIGGRWEQTYRDRQGEFVSTLRAQIEKTLADVRDPEAQAELAEVEKQIEALNETFRDQQARTQQWIADNPNDAVNDYIQNVQRATGEEPLDFFAVEDKAWELRKNCRAYIPWFFPKNIVVPSEHGNFFDWIEQGKVGWWGTVSNDQDDAEWLETLLRVLDKFDDQDRLVYIDFHV